MRDTGDVMELVAPAVLIITYVVDKRRPAAELFPAGAGLDARSFGSRQSGPGEMADEEMNPCMAGGGRRRRAEICRE